LIRTPLGSQSEIWRWTNLSCVYVTLGTSTIHKLPLRRPACNRFTVGQTPEEWEVRKRNLPLIVWLFFPRF